MHSKSNQKNNQMRKLFLSLIAMSFIWISCENQNTNEQAEMKMEEATDMTPQFIDINNFDQMADGLANQLVEIKGTVMHTCKHGGTKMFLAGTDPDYRVKVLATDESGNFNLEMEGNDFVVVGILDEYRVDNAELDRLEAEVYAESTEVEEDMKHKTDEADSEHADHGGDEHAEKEGSCEIQGQLDQIQALRDQIAESGKEYLSFYSIKAKTYKPVK